jgi:hypothetical protein
VGSALPCGVDGVCAQPANMDAVNSAAVARANNFFFIDAYSFQLQKVFVL